MSRAELWDGRRHRRRWHCACFLKHVRNWSYETLEREVRSFCRIGTEKVPDAKTLDSPGTSDGPETLRELHDRIVALAQQQRECGEHRSA